MFIIGIRQLVGGHVDVYPFLKDREAVMECVCHIGPHPMLGRDLWLTAAITTYSCRLRQAESRRNPPLCRSDGEQMPQAGHALESVSATLLEFES